MRRPDGVLEEWEYYYLVKLDVDTASVALVGGQYYDDEEYFSLDDRHVIVALRHDDGSYDILCDDSINDGGDFFGYHNTMEEASRLVCDGPKAGSAAVCGGLDRPDQLQQPQ